MPVLPVGGNYSLVQTEGPLESATVEKTHGAGEPGPQNKASDSVEISEEGRAKAEGLKTEKADDQTSVKGKRKSTSIAINDRSDAKNGDSDKEEAVDELKDTNSDIRKKKNELQEAKAVFFGSEEEQAQRIKDLKQDIDDLEDTKKELETKLSM